MFDVVQVAQHGFVCGRGGRWANDVAPSSQPTDGDTLNSDVEGDVDSEDWYTEMEVDAGIVDEGDVGQPRPELQVEGAEEEDLSEGSDGGLDGEVLLARQKRHAKRQLKRSFRVIGL
ncbi:hypothetical protein PF008_g23375 [Phytophthora fragariae]|uniref:Uncharacterized protein n=2 Tax=Phytophthora fragariae TaxID=53985 RepID=A0A6G0QRN0_9STRA|nr:hypothetical protein PF008_g23375 [Phytophthora fragariae]